MHLHNTPDVILNPYRFAGGSAPSRTYRDSEGSGDNLTTYTFSSMSIGPASERDYVIVFIPYRALVGRTVSSVSIGGVSASEIIANGVSRSSIAAYQAVVPSGTTGDVVVTLSGGALRAAVFVYTVKDISSITPVDTDTGGGASSSSDISMSLDVPSGNSIVLSGCLTRDEGMTWTSLTEDAAIPDIEGQIAVSSASESFTGPETLSINIDPTSSTIVTDQAAVAFVLQ